jgi:hypothetical protein
MDLFRYPALEKFIDHLTRGFTPELAKHFAELPKPDQEFQARFNELAEKANAGALSVQEAAEYEKYIEYMDFIALLRIKARARVAAEISDS